VQWNPRRARKGITKLAEDPTDHPCLGTASNAKAWNHGLRISPPAEITLDIIDYTRHKDDIDTGKLPGTQVAEKIRI